MSRTYALTLPVAAYTQSFAANRNLITATYTLSSETFLATPPLSGDATYCRSELYVNLGPVTGPSLTLSAGNADIRLRYPSIYGNQDVYGYLTTSTYTSATSAFTASVKFGDNFRLINTNVFNTVFDLSGNGFTSVIQSTSQLDNPMYVPLGGAVNSPSSQTLSAVNINFVSVANHLRKLNSEG